MQPPIRHLLAALIAAVCLSAAAHAQTIRTLGYNTTNGQVIANTGTNVLTFTNSAVYFSVSDIQTMPSGLSAYGIYLNFEERRIEDASLSNSVVSWSDGENITTGLPIAFVSTNDASSTRANLGFSTNLNTLWTATNAAAARSAVGLGATNNSFSQIGGANTSEYINLDNAEFFGGPWTFDQGFTVNGDVAAATTRTNLGLPIPALTNTSNVTMMRALAGSTWSNEPFSGSFEFKNATDDVFVAVVSNGIILNITEP